MTINDVLRRIRFTFDFSDLKIVEIFNQSDHTVNKDQIKNWLKKEDDPENKNCPDTQLF